jgi:diadenosine tetraphosphatase ApaH/serine/threonine PP2A family protein phosphatase
MDDLDRVDVFFASFEALLTSEEDPSDSIGHDIPIPTFGALAISELLEIATDRFKAQSTLLEISGPVIIVGDIHGNLQDLVRVLRYGGLQASYLFLGDYVDRGDFSLEVILLLLILTCRYPDRFFLLRGNHECRSVASSYGFRADVCGVYNSQLFDEFITAFDWLPLAAVVNQSIFCVHGGLCPELHSLSQFAGIQRPICLDSDSLARRILWSDPARIETAFKVCEGIARFEFGPIAVATFLGANGLSWIVRGHQSVTRGVRRHGGMRVMTVFSTSNYSGLGSNGCGVLRVGESGDPEPRLFEPLRTMMARSDVSFRPTGGDPSAVAKRVGAGRVLILSPPGRPQRTPLVAGLMVKRSISRFCDHSAGKRARGRPEPLLGIPLTRGRLSQFRPAVQSMISIPPLVPLSDPDAETALASC